MKSGVTFLFLLLWVLFSGCTTEEDVDPTAPQACFELSAGDIYAEASILFNPGCSRNGDIYVWDFGDGDASSLPQPDHIYDEPGQYIVTLTVSNDLNQFHTLTKSITVQPSPFIKHSGYIDLPEIWDEGLHMVNGNVYIRHGSLEIKPGASIFINEGKSIYVGHRETTASDNAFLKAIGTVSKPIVFQPSSQTTEPGSWGHLFFTETASDDNELAFCEIKYGGKISYYDGWTYYTSHGLVDIAGSGVSIKYSRIEGAANYGVALDEKGFFTAFENNTLTGNTGNTIYIGMDNAHTIGSGNVIQDEKGIFVHGQYYFQPNGTWLKQDVPYILKGEKRISTGSNGPGNLTIAPGTTIEMMEGASIEVGLYSEGHLYTSSINRLADQTINRFHQLHSSIK